jgi:DNA replication protein DnaC
MTDWMLDTLFFLLNSRYMAKRATLITTNFPDVAPDVAARDQSHRRKEYLVERVGTRLRSRLMEMCLVVKMQGKDHRQAKQEGNDVALRAGVAAAAPAPAPPPPRPRFGG